MSDEPTKKEDTTKDQPTPKKRIGRPPKYKTPQELEEVINRYFEKCDKGRPVEVVTPRGQVVVKNVPIPYTIEGLGLEIGLDRQGILNYSKKEEFHDIISRAKQKIFANWQERGLSGEYNAKVATFVLAANAGYRVTETQEHRFPALEEGIRELARIRKKEIQELAKARALAEIKKLQEGKVSKSKKG